MQRNNHIEIGDFIYFGEYYQENNLIKEPLLWKVLDVRENLILMITNDIIDCVPFHRERKDISWEESSIKNEWIYKFMNEAFSQEEMNKIKTCHNDQVFLLSIDEIFQYLKNDSDREAKGTKYAIGNGLYVNQDNGNSIWWLRSKGYWNTYRICVGTDGYTDTDEGDDVDRNYVGVRPVLWIEI